MASSALGFVGYWEFILLARPGIHLDHVVRRVESTLTSHPIPAQVLLLTSMYPVTWTQGKAFEAFWIIFNLGGMAGALLPFRNRPDTSAGESNDQGTVTSSTYLCKSA